MKNLLKLTTTLLIFCSFSAKAQERKLVWDYPIKPGTEEWRALSTRNDMVKVSQIPDDVLKTISTEDLVVVCLNYPLFPDLYAHNNRLEAMRRLVAEFNGFQELLLRKDNVQHLLNLLQSKDVEAMPKRELSALEQGKFSVNLALLKGLLAHKPILANATTKQQQVIASTAFKILIIQEQYPQTYGGFSLGASAYLLGVFLKELVGDKDFSPDLELFLKTGGVLFNTKPIEELKQIYSQTQKH